MTPKVLPSDIAALLFERLNDEYTAHYFYRNATNYCENIGYTEASGYFKKEAEDELTHAEGLQKYLTDWNVMPMLQPISQPLPFKGLVDIIEKAYTIEYDLYEAYEDISMAIFKKNDLCTFDFLSKYRTIQRESVAEYATLLNKLELINKTDKNWLNNFQQETFES